ncbi:hypothetical protein NDA03_25895 [Trichocoleus sp. Lan]|uniref:hypothetical protein n=1 Tax=Trichocoleus sp. Lan TaxID=2933927 RepID=UPI00329A03CE
MSEECTYSHTELNIALTQATLMLCQGNIVAAAELYDQLLREAVTDKIPRRDD